VTPILQDGEGFVWIGTEGDPNRYDGYTFTAYQHNSRDPHSLSDNHVTDLYEDARGRLRVTTREGGLNLDGKHHSERSAAEPKGLPRSTEVIPLQQLILLVLNYPSCYT
jgi:ligand-binding sensor domain-containing protein